MSMDYGSNFVETIEEKTVEETCPCEFVELVKVIENQLEENELDVSDIDELAFSIKNDEKIPEPIKEAYQALCDAFEKQTGLPLGLGYHDTDEGSRYDDIDGSYWWIGNVYQMTPEAKRLEDKIQRKFFVTFG